MSKKTDLIAEAEALGVELPDKVTIPQIEKAIEDHLAGDAAPEPAPNGDAPGTDLERVDLSGAISQVSTLPEVSKWRQMEQMAERLCRSDIVPKPLRDRPANTLLVLLGGHDLGIPPTQAFAKLHVIEGRLTMSAEVMVALILAAGHEIWPDPDNDATQAIAHCRRSGSDQVVSVQFTLEEAAKIRYRTNQGWKDLVSKDNWVNYPADMLWARVVTRAGRRRFPDVLAGVTYTPEELGAITDAQGDVIDLDPAAATTDEPPPPADEAAVRDLEGFLGALADDDKTAVREAWKAADPTIPPLRPPQGFYLSADDLERATALVHHVLAERHPDDGIDDADVVPDPPAAHADAPKGDGVNTCTTCGVALGASEREAGTGYCAGCAPF